MMTAVSLSVTVRQPGGVALSGIQQPLVWLRVSWWDVNKSAEWQLLKKRCDLLCDFLPANSPRPVGTVVLIQKVVFNMHRISMRCKGIPTACKVQNRLHQRIRETTKMFYFSQFMIKSLFLWSTRQISCCSGPCRSSYSYPAVQLCSQKPLRQTKYCNNAADDCSNKENQVHNSKNVFHFAIPFWK